MRNQALSRPYSDEEARQEARSRYGSDDIEIDPGARVIHLDDKTAEYSYGAAWVQAWLYVSPREEA